jgi:hypothetical protein
MLPDIFEKDDVDKQAGLVNSKSSDVFAKDIFPERLSKDQHSDQTHRKRMALTV